MKAKITLVALSLLFVFKAHSQSTINTADLPHANDTFRVSIGQIDQGLDISTTGPSAMWDFSQLVHTSQRVDSFIDESATNPLFAIVFIDNALNTNRANHATSAAGFNLGALINLSDVYNFYYNSSASYKQVGLGAGVNGIPLPITYSPHDIIYKLPLQYPSVDSSDSGYSINLISTLGIYFNVDKTRKNEVDGWGNLSTPFGSFDVLRIHSTVIEQDSLYIDSLGLGYNFPAITSHEYKWLGNGQGIPLLQINTAANGLITQVIYKDSIKTSIGIQKIDPSELSLNIYPNPAKAQATIDYSIDKTSMVSVELISATGQSFQIITSEIQSQGEHSVHLDIRKKNLTPGFYFVRILVNEKSYVRSLVISALD